MPDISDRLARLHDLTGAASPPSDAVVAADLRRGHRALQRRRARRAGAGVVGVAAAAAVVTVAVTAGPGSTSTPQAGGAPATPTTSVPSSPAVHPTSHPAQRRSIELVAYHGDQRRGFTVASVPQGYVLQGVSGSTLDIAAADDHSSLDTFSGKLTVGIEAASEVGGLGTYHGRPVTINGQPGVISSDDYTTSVVYEQGHGSGNLVTVQCWRNIALTQDQLVAFAKGVTVTAAAERQHG